MGRGLRAPWLCARGSRSPVEGVVGGLEYMGGLDGRLGAVGEQDARHVPAA